MPITLPKIDDRRYPQLVEEALARIPVHTPEWTNFNRSDPGVTLIEVFAFLTESLLYRANQIPERNRRKFLQLLRIPLRTAVPSRGVVTISNDAPSPTPEAVGLNEGIEVRAGQVPFRTQSALDVLPVEGRLFVKKKLANPSGDVTNYYKQLYASYRGDAPDLDLEMYESVPFPARDGVPLSPSETTDNSFWLALLVRDADARNVKPEDMPAKRDLLRGAIANRTLTLGVVPSLLATEATLPSGRPFASRSTLTMNASVPRLSDEGGLRADRTAEYKSIETRADVDVFSVVGTVNISLPEESQMRLWNNLDPLESGVDALPPAIDDETVASRVVTWIRLTPSAPTTTSFLWMGINAVAVSQRARVVGELLPNGTGEPDQVVKLSLAPVLYDSVQITVQPPNQAIEPWRLIDDLFVAPAEVPLPDPTAPRGAAAHAHAQDDLSAKVFLVNAESGEVRFGDGIHGARPPEGAVIRATYDYALGLEGNVGTGTIKTSPALPDGFSVVNPIPTWGGADAETVEEGEKQISRYLQHRNRLVTVNDFVNLTLRTPGVDIARVEVLPNYHPTHGSDSPGVVTLMLIPAYDPDQPDAPLPRPPFLEAVCRHLDPRRLITTQIVLRGPEYQGIWISIGVKVDAGFNESQVTEAVKQDIVRFLMPFTSGGREQLPDSDPVVLGTATPRTNGWKLGKSVVALELVAVANRTRGVEFARNDVILAKADGTIAGQVELSGLQLPRILGIRVTNGAAAPLSDLMGGTGGGAGTGGAGTGGGTGTGGGGEGPRRVQVPVIPEECRC